jgi:molybdopterin-guanine dinucleotide biosynthesis adapter protein
MDVIAVAGPSGSGKTTRIVELIRENIAAGRTVGAIKHTHHPLNEENRGDTAKFLEAGARPVILAGDGEAVVFDGAATHRATYAEPRELLVHFSTDLVVVEGFKNAWPSGTAQSSSISTERSSTRTPRSPSR